MSKTKAAQGAGTIRRRANGKWEARIVVGKDPGTGKPDARPHDLRHTAAIVALASGADIKSVQGLLGHATAAFTLDKYGHVTERMMKDTAARMQNYYDGLAVKG